LTFSKGQRTLQLSEANLNEDNCTRFVFTPHTGRRAVGKYRFVVFPFFSALPYRRLSNANVYGITLGWFQITYYTPSNCANLLFAGCPTTQSQQNPFCELVHFDDFPTRFDTAARVISSLSHT
jgi:hypothetical protein